MLKIYEVSAKVVEVSPHIKVQDQVSDSSDLPVFRYSKLKPTECLQTTSRVTKNERTLVYKIIELSLSPKSKLLIIYPW